MFMWPQFGYISNKLSHVPDLDNYNIKLSVSGNYINQYTLVDI